MSRLRVTRWFGPILLSVTTYTRAGASVYMQWVAFARMHPAIRAERDRLRELGR